MKIIKIGKKQIEKLQIESGKILEENEFLPGVDEKNADEDGFFEAKKK